jgi:hypothetical protein
LRPKKQGMLPRGPSIAIWPQGSTRERFTAIVRLASLRLVTRVLGLGLYEGDELLGTEVYLKGAQRIIQRFKELAPDAVIEPYQQPPRHAERVQEKRTGVYDTDRKGR